MKHSVTAIPDERTTVRRKAYALPAYALAAAGLLILALAADTRPARAFDLTDADRDAEYAALKSCEKQFCQIVLMQEPVRDFSCRLQKTWAKKQLKDNVERKSLSWTVGDARCHAVLNLTRLNIVTAATSPKWTVEFPPHVAHCDVEREGGLATVDVTLAPKILFRKGVAEKAWINVQKVDAPSGWKTVLWSVAKLEDTVGVFHRDILKEINKLMNEKCRREYGTAAATATPAPQSTPKSQAGGAK